MPLFDFRCAACGKTFEERVAFGAKATPACPACGSRTTEKLLSPPAGIVFKGSGWYKTDSRQAHVAPKKDEAKRPDKTEKKGETKIDAPKKTDA